MKSIEAYKKKGIKFIPFLQSGDERTYPYGDYYRKFENKTITEQEIKVWKEGFNRFAGIVYPDLLLVDIDEPKIFEWLFNVAPKELATQTWVQLTKSKNYHVLFRRARTSQIKITPIEQGFVEIYSHEHLFDIEPTPNYKWITNIENVEIKEISEEDEKELVQKAEFLRENTKLIRILEKLWKREQRHIIALHFSAYLRKKNFEKENIAKIVEVVCALTNDEEKKDRLRAVKDAFEKSKNEIAGYSVLKEYFEKDLTKDEITYLKTIRQPKLQNENTDEKEDQSKNLEEIIENCYIFDDTETNQTYLWNGEDTFSVPKEHRGSSLFKWLTRTYFETYGNELTLSYEEIYRKILSRLKNKDTVRTVSSVVGDNIVLDKGNKEEIIVTKDTIVKRAYTLPWMSNENNLDFDLKASCKDIKKLFEYLNMKETDKLIYASAIAFSYIDDKSQPMILLKGNAGCGKSTSCRMVSHILLGKDKLVKMKKEINDLLTYILNNKVIFFDNLEELKDEDILETLSCAVTGAYIAKRRLYTDADEFGFAFKRPFFCNSITIAVERSDVMDRTIVINMPKINFTLFKEKFQGVDEILWKSFFNDLPTIRGSIVKILQHYLKVKDKIKLQSFFRFSDFARFFIAFCDALGIEAEEAEKILLEKTKSQKEDEINDSELAYWIEVLLKENRYLGAMDDEDVHREYEKYDTNEIYVGTPTHLLSTLKELSKEKSRFFFREITNTKKLSTSLKLIAPILEEVRNIKIERKKVAGKRLLIIFREKENNNWGDEDDQDDEKQSRFSHTADGLDGLDAKFGESEQEEKNSEEKNFMKKKYSKNCVQTDPSSSDSDFSSGSFVQEGRIDDKIKTQLNYLCQRGTTVVRVSDISRVLNFTEKDVKAVLEQMNLPISEMGIVDIKNFGKTQSKEENYHKDMINLQKQNYHRNIIKLDDILKQVQISAPEPRISTTTQNTYYLIDADYQTKDNKTLVTLFCRNNQGEAVSLKYVYEPYFYTKEKPPQQYQYEEVSLYPIWRFGPKEKYYKVILDEPQEVPIVRSYFGETYESDLPFVDRFLIDKGLGAGVWFNKDLERVDIKDEPNVKVLAFDIEVFNSNYHEFPSPKTEENEIVLIHIITNTKEEITLGTLNCSIRDYKRLKDEKELLLEFEKIIQSLNPDIITGYNITNFDFPFIVERAKKYKIKLRIGKEQRKELYYERRKDTASSKQHYKGEYTLIKGIEGRVVLDCFDLIKHNILGRKLEQYSLDFVSKSVLGKSKKNIKPSELVLKLRSENENELRETIEYVRRDSELALELFEKENYLKKISALSNVSFSRFEDVIRGQSRMINHLLFRYCKENGYIMKNNPSEIEKEQRKKEKIRGAIVLEPEKGVFENVALFDFASLYPTIIKSHNLSWDTETEEGDFVSREERLGLLPKIVEDLLEKRRENKKLFKETGESIYDNLQYAYKILANSIYGYSGFIYARAFSSVLSNKVTEYGREYLNMVKSLIQELGYKVIAGDTDSVFVKIENEEDITKILKAVKEKLPQEIILEFETLFKTIIFFEKKRYIGLTQDNKMIQKGIELVRRDWCLLTKKALNDVLGALLQEKDVRKAFEIRKMWSNKIRKGEFALEDLIITGKLSKSIDEYKGKDIHVEVAKKMKQRGKLVLVGDRVPFVVLNTKINAEGKVLGNGLFVERGEDPEFVKENGLERFIDKTYYINKQLFEPIDRLLREIKNEINLLKY